MAGSRMTAAGFVMIVLSAAPAISATAVSPFRAMAGNWLGGGIISMANGQQERLRCRASYEVTANADQLRLNLRCASDSYNFDLTSEVEYHGGAISGGWTEASRNVSGTISGRAAGDRVEAAATGPNFSANLSLTTRGNRQTVSIRPAGSDIREVSVGLQRR